jgi:hypothetical protein
VKFENKSNARGDVHSAFLTCTRTNWQGRPFKVQTAVRAIRERSGKWRIDHTTAVAGTWMPWEPVNTNEYGTLTAAKTALREYGRACKVPGWRKLSSNRELAGRRRR